MNKPEMLMALAIAGAILLPWSGATAQDAAADGADRTAVEQDLLNRYGLPVYLPDEVDVTLFTPDFVESVQLLQSVQQIHGRRFVLAENGADQKPPYNLQVVGDSLLIYDTPEYTARVLKTLERLDQEGVAKSPQQRSMLTEADLQVYEYAPQFLSLEAAYEALQPFQGKTQIRRADSMVTSINALSASEELGHIVIRETPEVIAAIQDLLARVDVPHPHITLHCMVLQATREQGDEDLPDELVDNLSALVPYDRFDRLTMGLITTSVKPGGKLSLRMPTDDGRNCSLQMRVGAFDGTGRTLTFEQLSFSMYRGPVGGSPAVADFTTAATLASGEYVVLGATGPQPIFVVLRMTSR